MKIASNIYAMYFSLWIILIPHSGFSIENYSWLFKILNRNENNDKKCDGSQYMSALLSGTIYRPEDSRGFIKAKVPMKNADYLQIFTCQTHTPFQGLFNRHDL